VLGGGAAGGIGDAVCAAVPTSGGASELAWWWGGEEQLVQLGDFHSLHRLGHKLVLIGVKAELVQQAGPRLAQLQLGVGAQDRDHDF
jgi:hypothetical protein